MSFSATPSSSSREHEPAWEVALLFPHQGEWSEEDYLLLTDSSNRPVEFDAGRIEVLEMPTEAHQLMVQFLFLRLLEFVTPPGLGTVLFAPLRVRLKSETYREPDVVLMLESNRHRRENRFWRGADLVVEVVSDDPKSRERDLVKTPVEFAQSGISEYWTVDPVEARIKVLRLQGTAYVEHGVYLSGQIATSALLEGFSVVVADVFIAAVV